MCKREQPKLAYKEAGGKVNAKKKKGKAAACNDCKAAGGDCVKLLSPAGFILAAIPDGHVQAYFNGVYSKTEQIVNSRHVYSGPNGINAWYFNGEWRIAEGADRIGNDKCGVNVESFAASPGSISNDSVWEVFEMQENGAVDVPMRGITVAALTVEALAAATRWRSKRRWTGRR